MSTFTPLEEALALALKLAPKERLQLIEQVASSVERDIEAVTSNEEDPEQHWGKALNKLMDEIGPIELLYPEIEDPVEWVKHLRAEERRRRLGDWGEANSVDDTE
jgi:hypothetical protein